MWVERCSCALYVSLFSPRSTKLHQTLHERIVGDERVGPEGLDELVFGHQSVAVLDQVLEGFEHLGPKLHFLRAPPKATPVQIEGELLEGIGAWGLRGGLAHG